MYNYISIPGSFIKASLRGGIPLAEITAIASDSSKADI